MREQMMNIESHYVEEHNLENVGAFKQMLLIIQNDTGMAIMSYVLLALAVLSLLGLIINYFTAKNDTVMQLSLGYLIMCILILGVATYIFNDKFKTIGHFEADVKVVKVSENGNNAIVENGNKKARVDFKDNQSFKKGDKAVIKTNTVMYEEKNIKNTVFSITSLTSNTTLHHK